MILVGIDDTDTLDSPGTNNLARRIFAKLPAVRVLRHQLFFDPRVPYTSHNGSASILVEDGPTIADVIGLAKGEMRERFVEGSDPGLCVTRTVPVEIVAFAHRCQTDVVRQSDARDLARAFGIHLEGLGGTEDGVIGALAAVALASTNDDGRVVHARGWPWPDEMIGIVDASAIRARGVEIRDADSGAPVVEGAVDLGKRLRPEVRAGALVLLVDRGEHGWIARRHRAPNAESRHDHG